MKLIRGALVAGLLFVSGCAVQSTTPGTTPASQLPTKPSHPRYAPPPGVSSEWVPSLGVYAVGGQRDMYYRERTYYRWNNGWSWSVSPNGPWTDTDSSGIPPGLYRQYSQ
ncbi:hypothetical protein AX279_20320 [Pseudomonas sp. J237]|nr:MULTISPECIES: hypothetical protein [Pseudomonas]OEO24168.1 hypothetical protein AX279_20320 [Pseudomonas sp. J237]